EARYLAAQIAVAEKDPDRALQELQEAFNKEPGKGQIYIDIGQVHMSKRDFKAAEEAFRKALAIDSKLFRARIALAQLYIVTGEQDKAEQELLAATKADPENENLLHLLGIFYSRTRQLDDFESLYQDLLKRKPDSLVAKKRLAELYLTKNDAKKAKDYIEQILKAAPDDLDGRYFRARIYLVENDPQQAYEDLGVTTRGAPRFAPGHYFMGQAELRLKKIKEALTSF